MEKQGRYRWYSQTGTAVCELKKRVEDMRYGTKKQDNTYIACGAIQGHMCSVNQEAVAPKGMLRSRLQLFRAAFPSPTGLGLGLLRVEAFRCSSGIRVNKGVVSVGFPVEVVRVALERERKGARMCGYCSCFRVRIC